MLASSPHPDEVRPSRRAGGPVRWPWIAGGWGVVALVAAGQTLLFARLAGRPMGVVQALTRHLPLLLLWALATPAVLRSARRFPVRRDAWLRPVLVHFALGTLFIVCANLAIRLPGVLPGGELASPGGLLRDTMAGLVRWYPLALVVYGVIVAAGHLLAGAGPDAAAAARPEAGRARDPDAGAGSPAVSSSLLTLRTEDGVRLVRPAEIEWIEADGNYVRVHGEDGRAHRIRRRLSELEERLVPEGFARVHRSTLVRLDAIREIRPRERGDCDIVLRGGDRVRLPRTRRGDLEALLGVDL
ncbi:MAG: LytTR family DNA-binding domain-containing protein [Gemmatimonadota bacterium]|jgi:hypothetical protein